MPTPPSITPHEQDNGFIPTRHSLLSRLKNLDDDESWRRFFETYWKLIYGVALKSGLNAAEAQDVVQETVLAVVRNIGQFKYDPARCSFKTWLLRVTHSRIANQFRRKQRHPDHDAQPLDEIEAPGHHDPALERMWDEEWDKNIMDAAIRNTKTLVEPDHFQIFDFYVLKGWTVKKVAQTFGVSSARVYLIKHRVSKIVRSEIQALEASQW